MSTRGYKTFCDGCGAEAADKHTRGFVLPALVGWINGFTCTSQIGVVQNRFQVCSVECLARYASKRVGSAA